MSHDSDEPDSVSELVLIRPLLPIILKMFHRLATLWEGEKLWLAGRYGRHGKLKLNLALELLTASKICLIHVFFFQGHIQRHRESGLSCLLRRSNG